MPKSNKKKPATAAPVKKSSSVMSALHPPIKAAADAGRPSATMGGKSASAKKGR